MNIIKKSLAVGVFLLFIGVAVAPSINFTVVKASNDNDLVEVTTQACGIKGYGDTTVKLTREQYQNLEEYLVEFRERLNQTATREEAVPIFKEAVVELDKYGLLPRGMSVGKAQRLVTGLYQKPFGSVLKERQHEIDDDLTNVFCLLYAEITLLSGDVSMLMPFGILFLHGFLMACLFGFAGFEKIALFLLDLTFRLTLWNPIRIMNIILTIDVNLKLQTIGLLGNIKGEFTDVYVVFFGYSGLMLFSEKSTFIGSAIGIL